MKKKKKTQIIVNIIAILLLLALFIALFVYFYDEIQRLNTAEGLEEFVSRIRETGFLGGVILVFIQTLQVTVAFIPGEFVELAAGVMFNPFLGLVLCLIGLNIGTAIIFGLVKWLGKPFVEENVSEKEHTHLRFLNDPNRALIILFFIFLIPGIPKDILIYPIPLTKVKMWKFMIVSSIARIPSILSSTFIGSSVLEQNYVAAGIVFAVFLVLAIIGLIFNKRIYEFIDKRFIKQGKKSD